MITETMNAKKIGGTVIKRNAIKCATNLTGLNVKNDSPLKRRKMTIDP